MNGYKPSLCPLNRVFYVALCQGQSTQNYGLSLQHVSYTYVCMWAGKDAEMWLALILAPLMMLFMMMDGRGRQRESLAGSVN